MKQILFTFFSLIPIILTAQDFYINFQTGYGFATEAGQSNYYKIENINGTEVREVIAGGFGEGLYAKLNVGYNYSDWIAFECGFSYLHGRTISTKIDYTSDNWINVKHNYSHNIQAFIFTPQFVFNLPTESKFQPYMKTGIAMGILMKANFKSEFSSINSSDQIKREIDRVLNGGMPLGFTAALGTKYIINKKITLVMDFNLLNMSYQPHKSTVVKYLIDDVDILNSLTVREREILYKNKVEPNDNSPNDNEPYIELPINLPMNNISFNFGLLFDL